MATLEELLIDDGFKRRRKPKPGLSGDTAGSNAASLPKHVLGPSSSKTRPVKTWVSDATGRKLGSLREPDGSVFGYLNLEELLIEEGSVRDHQHVCSIKESEVKSKTLMATESMHGKFSGRLEKFRHSRHYKTTENKEQKGKKAQILPVRPSFKDVRGECLASETEEGSLKAITSMINACLNQLIEDESFRLSVHQACVSSLKSRLVQNRQPVVNGVIFTLKEAIGDVERIITEGCNELELKKCSFKLSVITGLKSMESDDGQTCGIPNLHIAACSHLYLSILYKIQKKDKFSAKHILQVFCDSPYQARTTLLPELWDQIFLPSLFHLKAWYEKEAESIPLTSHMMMKLEFLEKVYNDIVEMGTSQVAAYLKALLMDDKKGPAFPSISIPFPSLPDKVEDADEFVSFESFSSCNSLSSKTMINNRIYESVLGQVKDEVGYETGLGKTNVWRGKYDVAMHMDNESQYTAAEDSLKHYGATSSEEGDQMKGNYCCLSSSGISESEEIKLGSEVRLSRATKKSISVGKCYPHQNENVLKLKKLAQAALQLKGYSVR